MGRKFKPVKFKNFTELNHRMKNDQKLKIDKVQKQWDDLNKCVPAYELNNENDKTSSSNLDQLTRKPKKTSFLRNSGESSKGWKKSDIQREVDKLKQSRGKKRPGQRHRRRIASLINSSGNSDMNGAETSNAMKNSSKPKNKLSAEQINSSTNKANLSLKRKRCPESSEESGNDVQTRKDLPKANRRLLRESAFINLADIGPVDTPNASTDFSDGNHLEQVTSINRYANGVSDDEAAENNSAVHGNGTVEDSDESYEIDLMEDSDQFEDEDEEINIYSSDVEFIDDDNRSVATEEDVFSKSEGKLKQMSNDKKRGNFHISYDEVDELLSENPVLNWTERSSRSKIQPAIEPTTIMDCGSSSDEDFDEESVESLEDEEEMNSSIGADEVDDLIKDIVGEDNDDEFFVNKEDEERISNLDVSGLKLKPIGLSIDNYFVDESTQKFIRIERDENCTETKEPGIFGLFCFSGNDKHSFNVGMGALRWLASPVDMQAFFYDIYTKRAMVVQRHNPDYYNNFFSLSDFYKMFQDNFLEYGEHINIALYNEGVRTTHNPSGRVYGDVIRALVEKGLSVQCVNPQCFSKNIYYLCEILQEVLHCFVGANCYYTPSGSAGFAPHYDNIDAFLIQTVGRKHWRVYAPADEEQWPLESSHNFSLDEMEKRKNKLVFDGWLYAGDVLYLPRGFIHHAETHPDHDSLHVTISVAMNYAYCNLLDKVVSKLMQAQTASITQLRRNLPCDLLDIDGVACTTYDNYANIARLLTPISLYVDQLQVGLNEAIPSAIDDIAREFMHRSLPPLLTDYEKAFSIHHVSDGVPKMPVFSRDMEVRLIRKHTQRLLFESKKIAFLIHRMENSMSYEGRPEVILDVPSFMIRGVERIMKFYPNWVPVEKIGKKLQKNLCVVKFLYHHGLLMIRPIDNMETTESDSYNRQVTNTPSSRGGKPNKTSNRRKRGKKPREPALNSC